MLVISFNGNPLEKIWLKHVETEGKVGNNEAINETKRSFSNYHFSGSSCWWESR